MTSKTNEEEFKLSKDLQVLIFQDPIELKLIPGEYNIAIISRVEDIKGHPGQYGQLQITNLRIIWFLQRIPMTNSSIGYNCIIHYRLNNSVQNTIGICETLCLRCKFKDKTFEFIYQAPKAQNSVFRFFETSLKNYQNSILYRDQKLRSSILNEGNLILLSNEQVIIQMNGVSNFSGEVAKIGNIIITNFRFIWFSEIVSNFNVSIPHILLSKLKLSETKRFGKCFFLKLFSNGTRFVYGFTISPEQKLIDFLKSFEKIRLSANNSPILTPLINNNLNINENYLKENNNNFKNEEFLLDNIDPTLYYLSPELNNINNSKFGLIFEKTLGLSIENIINNNSIQDKWNEASNTPLVTLDLL